MTPTQTHSEWIAAWLSDNNPYGQCKEACAEMMEVFEDLTLVPGHVFTNWGMRDHFWCVDTAGNIVDPTATQFGWVMEYEPWVPGTEVRVGKCMECGEEIWEAVQDLSDVPRKDMCNDRCARAFEADLNAI